MCMCNFVYYVHYYSLLYVADKRDKGGFWLPFRVFAVYGFFQCPVDSNCNWRSRDIQVDVMVGTSVGCIIDGITLVKCDHIVVSVPPSIFPASRTIPMPLPIRSLALNTAVASSPAASALQQVLRGVAVPALLLLQLPLLCTCHLGNWNCEDTTMSAAALEWILFLNPNLIGLSFSIFWIQCQRSLKDLWIHLNNLFQFCSNLIKFL